MERLELIRLVKQIQEADGPEDKLDVMLEELKSNVPHPEVSDLIFYADPELSAEDIVDQVLAYKPIQL